MKLHYKLLILSSLLLFYVHITIAYAAVGLDSRKIDVQDEHILSNREFGLHDMHIKSKGNDKLVIQFDTYNKGQLPGIVAIYNSEREVEAFRPIEGFTPAVDVLAHPISGHSWGKFIEKLNYLHYGETSARQSQKTHISFVMPRDGSFVITKNSTLALKLDIVSFFLDTVGIKLNTNNKEYNDFILYLARSISDDTIRELRSSSDVHKFKDAFIENVINIPWMELISNQVKHHVAGSIIAEIKRKIIKKIGVKSAMSSTGLPGFLASKLSGYTTIVIGAVKASELYKVIADVGTEADSTITSDDIYSKLDIKPVYRVTSSANVVSSGVSYDTWQSEEGLKRELERTKRPVVKSGLNRKTSGWPSSTSHNNLGDSMRHEIVRNMGLKPTRQKALELKRRLARHDVDVLFLADNTGSMGGIIRSVNAKAQSILDALAGHDERFKNVNIQWGVARYLGDPSEPQIGEPGESVQIIQAVTGDEAAVQAALDEWFAYGGGDGPEANFYALQQVATSGEGVPRDDSDSTGINPGWRKGAARVIVVFGDAPSHQETVNEKELHEVLKATGARVSFIDTSSLNLGSNSNNWDATSGTQAIGAAQEIADGSGGSYIRLTETENVDKAIKNAVYDAITQNKRTGGQLARVSSGHWRSRTPSAVTALTPDDGKSINFTLRHPGQSDAKFGVAVDKGVDVPNTIYFERTDMTGMADIFGANLSDDSVVQFTGDKDFFRFVLRGNDPSRNSVAGYYGLKTRAAALPKSGNWGFALSSRSVSPFDGRVYSGEQDGLTTQLGVSWATDAAFGLDSAPPTPGGGVGVFVGSVDRSAGQIHGRYVAVPYPDSSGRLGFIRDTDRGNTSLQIYGDGKPKGLGGTFSAYWFDKSDRRSYTDFLMSGFWNQNDPPSRAVNVDTWHGFATAQAYDPVRGTWAIALSDAPDDLQFDFQKTKGTFDASIRAKTYQLRTDKADSAYVGATSFGAVKEMHDAPAYVATSAGSSSGTPDKYSFLSWGSWSKKEGVSPRAVVVSPGSSWIAGRLTPGHDIPLTGKATYSGDVMGRLHDAVGSSAIRGDANLTARFGDRKLTGRFDNFRRADGSAWLKGHGLSVNGSWSKGVNAIHGSVAGPGDLTGKMHGAFFGPNAEEVGGNWRVHGSGVKAGGVFAGKH